MKRTRKNLFGRAERLGLHVAIYSPGDGVTRYRFIRRDDPSLPADAQPGEYYNAAFGLGTVCGLAAAHTWLDGFEAAVKGVHHA